MTRPPRTRRGLARALIGAPSRRAALRLARAAGTLADRECMRLLEERFREQVRVSPASAVAVVRAAAAVAHIDTGASCVAAWRGLAGVHAHVSGRSAEADAHLAEAVRRAADAGEWSRVGDVERVRIDVLGSLGRAAEARRAARRARAAYRRDGGGGPRRRGAVAMHLGHLFHRIDDHRRALESYSEARREYRRAGDDVLVAQAEFNRANALLSLDRTVEARERFAEARRAFAEAGQTVLVAGADRAVAEIDRLEGELDRALDRLDAVREVRRRIGDHPGVAHTDLERAEVLLRLNRVTEAARAAESARKAFRTSGRDASVAQCELVLAGCDLHAGKPRRAARRFATVERGLRLDGNAVGAATARIGRARAELAAGAPDVAADLARGAARSLARGGPVSRRARANVVVADAERARGRGAAARRHGREALRIARRVADRRTELAAVLVLADVERDAGRPAIEYRLLRSAERCVESLRAGVTAEESRLAFAVDKSVVYERLIRNRLDRGDAAAVRQALVFAERGKSRALADRLASGRGRAHEFAGGAADRLMRRLRSIERDLACAETRIESDDPKGIRSGAQERVRSLSADRLDVLRRLTRVAPAAATLVGARPPDPWAVVGALDPRDLVLEYAESDGRFHLFAVERDRVRAFPDLCSVVEIEGVLDRLRFQLGKGVLGDGHAERFGRLLSDSVRRHHERLFDALLSPVAGEIDGRRLRIVPHGALHGLPFHALERHGRVVVDRCEVSYAPSLTVLGLLREAGRPHDAPPLVLGVPDRAAPAIEAEVEAVCAHLGNARVFHGCEATSRKLLEGLGRPEVLHVACHGFYAAGDGFTGGLRLGDAWVTLPEIYTLPESAALVVLSGCETGRGTVYSGDEWVGLVRGFLQAGARAVVASLWEVHDASAVTIMDDFYRALADGAAVGDALAGAQRRARDADEYPLHWAPFVVVGDPTYRLEAQRVA